MTTFRLLLCVLWIAVLSVFGFAQTWDHWDQKTTSFERELFDTRTFVDSREQANVASTENGFDVIYRGKSPSFFPKQFQLRLYGNVFYDITDLETGDWGKARSDMKGFMVGAELKVKRTVWGVYYQGAYNDQEWTDFLKEEVKNQVIGLTYQKLFGLGHFLVNVNGGMDEYAFPTVFDPGLKFDGKQLNAYTELGFNIPIGFLTIKPFGGLHYNYLQHDSLTLLDIYEFEKEEFNGLNALIGARGNMKWGGMGIQVRASWVYNCFSGSPTYKTYYGGYSGVMTPTQWSVAGNTDRNWYWLGAGVKWSLGQILTLYADYDIMQNRQQVSHLLSGGIRLSF